MEASFGPNEQNATIDVQATAAPAPAPTETATNSVPAVIQSAVPATSSGLILGDRIPDFKDIILPRLNLAQNIGQLKDSFDPGTLVLDQKVQLFAPAQIDRTGKVIRAASLPATLVVFGFRPTRYVEKVEGGARGLIVDSEDAVRANGGTLDYGEWKLKEKSGMKRFEPLADALVAVQRPDEAADDDTVFGYEVEGIKYALALWACKGTVYTAACKRVFFANRAMGCTRKGGYPSFKYAVSTREQSFGAGRAAWVPVCIPTAPTTPAFLDFVRSVIG